MPHSNYVTKIDATPRDVYDWHASRTAIDRLMPPWENTRVLRRPDNLDEGSVAEFEISKFKVRERWVARHVKYEGEFGFADVQDEGPFSHWKHVHEFKGIGEGTELRDAIEWSLPWYALPGTGFVTRELDRMFAFRHERTRRDVSRLTAATPKVTVAISGASGMIGQTLSAFLRSGGHRVVHLVRSRDRISGPDEIYWDPYEGQVDDGLQAADAVVHLSGRSIAGSLWTEKARREIKESRVRSTQTLANALAKYDDGPKALIAASAVGYYGDRGDEALDEIAGPGSGFLAEVGEEWEAATATAAAQGIRVVNLRLGVVLSAAGGVLKQMLPVFELGAAGRLGSGRQWFAWVSLDDVVGAMLHLISNSSLEGPVNLVAPECVTNLDYTKTLAGVLNRPAFLAVPSCVIKFGLGDLGKELLLASQRVVPSKLLDDGFEFLDPGLRGALEFELGAG